VFSFSVSIEIGVILPTSTPDPAQPILGDVRESARFAEEAGLDSVWSTDHVIASAPILDSTVVLATAAAVTGRVKIGFGVMLLALRPVAWAAKQISTLQYVSGERVLLGVGTGNPAHGDTGWRAVELAIGLSPEAVAARLGELRRLTDELGRPALTATVVGPQLDADPQRAAEQLSAYEAAGTQQVILPPTGTDWRAGYEFAAVRAARR
jgi:alkanesulfonate monooxygenase SsuD/methylene tetrahydromethanopterin reductase-like flavin-dependent oxidoreductase (luciferase family)